MAFLNYKLNDNADSLLTAEASTENEGAGEGSTSVYAQSAEGDYFDMFRIERDEARDMEIGYLDEIIAASSTDAETLAEAQQQKLAIVGSMEKELVMESLIMAKGFSDVAVTMGAGTVNVVVDAGEISGEQAAKILDIVISETGYSADQVKIVANGQ